MMNQQTLLHSILLGLIVAHHVWEPSVYTTSCFLGVLLSYGFMRWLDGDEKKKTESQEKRIKEIENKIDQIALALGMRKIG